MLKRFATIGLCLALTACVTGGPSTPRQDMRPNQPLIDKAESNARVQRGAIGAQMSLPEAYEAAVFDMALEAMRQIRAGLDPTPEYVARIQELGRFELDNLFIFHMSTGLQGVGVGIGGGPRDAAERMQVVAFGEQAAAANERVETRLIAEGWFVAEGRLAGNAIMLSCWIAPDQYYEVCLGPPSEMDGATTITAEVGFVAEGAAL